LSVVPQSNAAFAESLGANQVVIGSAFEAGRQVRLGLDVYDTRSYVQLGHYGIDGSPDAIISLLDQLAESVAVAFCKQPEFNPRNLCFENPARPMDSVLAHFEGAVPATPPNFEVLVSADGNVSDVRQPDSVAQDVVTASLNALRTARYLPARKGKAAVAAWTRVPVHLVPADRALEASTTGAVNCASPVVSLRNPNKACWDIPPTPLSAPIVAVPKACGRTVSGVAVLARVSAEGKALGMPPPAVTQRVRCAAFGQAAMAFARDLRFQPATKSGTPVAAWTQVLIRPAQ